MGDTRKIVCIELLGLNCHFLDEIRQPFKWWVSHRKMTNTLFSMTYQRKARRSMASKESTRLAQRGRAQALSSRRSYTVGYGGIGEVKALDTDLSTADVCSTEVITCINVCSQGTSLGTRVGREIQMLSVQIKGYFYPTGAHAGGMVFWSLVYDRQSNGAVPDWDDVYTTDAIQPQLRNLDGRKRFKVLGSGFIPTPKVGADYLCLPFEFFKKIKYPVTYNGANQGDVTDVMTGGLIWMCRGTIAQGADDCTLAASVRVRFTDM